MRVRAPLPELVIGCGGVAAAVGAALRRGGRPVVQVQHPRMDPRRFDLVVVNRHDELTGPNVVVTRTALHRVTPARLAERPQRMARRASTHLKRPLVAVLVGGSNGRFRLDGGGGGGSWPAQLASMMQRDGVGVAVTPSRRTDPAAMRVLAEALIPLGGYVWDGTGENPYFGMLALADAIVVTVDSVSMVSEAVGDIGAGAAGAAARPLAPQRAVHRLHARARAACASSPAGSSSGRWRRWTTRRRRRPKCAGGSACHMRTEPC